MSARGAGARAARFLPLSALSGLIFWFSSRPAEISAGQSGAVTGVVLRLFQCLGLPSAQAAAAAEPLEFLIRKGAHFGIYFGLGASAMFAFRFLADRRRVFPRIPARTGASAAYCLLFAASDELHQLFIPGRSGMLRDVALDFCGALAGIALFCLLGARRARKRQCQTKKRD